MESQTNHTNADKCNPFGNSHRYDNKYEIILYADRAPTDAKEADIYILAAPPHIQYVVANCFVGIFLFL